jgi:hypothetical protein
MLVSRRHIVVPVVAVVVLAGGVTAAWQAGWPHAIFGSPAATQSAVVAPVQVSARSATPYQVAPDVYVNSVAAWKGLTAASRSSLLARLHAKEQQFRAAGSKVFPPVSSFTVRPAPAGLAAGTAALGAGNLLLAARVDTGRVAAEADFGAAALGDQPLVAGSATYDRFTDPMGWTPCVSVATSLPGTPTLDICAGQIVGATGYVPQLGMAAALIAASGVAANRAELPVTATYKNRSGHQAKIVVTASAASISVSLHAQLGVGCEPSQLLYATPGSGHLALSPSDSLLDDLTGCFGTAGSAIPAIGTVPKVVDLLTKGQTWLSGFADAYQNVAHKTQLAASPALQACATGQTISDVVAIMSDLGPVGAPTCNPHPLPAWTGTMAAGQTLQFTAAPVAEAYTFGQGAEITALFSFLHLHVTQCPVSGPCQPGWSAPAEVATGPITSVSCSGQFCAAVGATGAYGHPKGFALTYRDGTWSKQVPLGTSNRYKVSCPAATFCQAVTDTGYAYAYRNGAWSGAADIYPAANGVHSQVTSADFITDVSCGSSGFCVAETAKGNALTWNGTRWSAPVSIGLPGISAAPPFIYSIATTGLSCPTTGYCLTAASLRDQPAAASWDGTRWSPAPPPPGGLADSFTSVSCTSAQFCMLVGGVHATGDISSTWNGTSWSGLANPGAGGAASGFGTVSCASPSLCAAFDAGAGVNGQQATTSRGSGIFTWANGTWAGPELIDPNGAFNAVSCSTSGFCLAADTAGNVYFYTPGAAGSSPATATSPSPAAACPTSAQLTAAWNAAPATVQKSWAPPGINITGFQGITCWSTWVVAAPISTTPGNGNFVFSQAGQLHPQPVAELQQFRSAVCSSSGSPAAWRGETIAGCQS